jgi:hypothetical protein
VPRHDRRHVLAAEHVDQRRHLHGGIAAGRIAAARAAAAPAAVAPAVVKAIPRDLPFNRVTRKFHLHVH